MKRVKVLYHDNCFDGAASAGLFSRFYATRTLTHQPIDPRTCAEAILFLAGPKAPCTTGHLIPVDGGLTDAFLR